MKRWRERVVDVYGWYGAVALLAAYALLSMSVIDRGWLFQTLNLTGALGVGLAAWSKRSYQAAVLEFIWAAIAVAALARLL
jgi:hypothetical protein